MIRKISLLLLIGLSLSSCVSSKKIIYFQGLSQQPNKTSEEGGAGENYDTKIKSDDLLQIIISAPNPTEAEPFNLPLVSIQQPTVGMLDAVSAQSRFQTYLVDKEGNIQFPVLGTLKVGGLQKAEVVTMLNSKLDQYITNPIVNLRIVNYKISVIGEVIRPGEYARVTERISIPEALALAGDLTIYGDRNDILLIRDVNGIKTHFSIDLTSADIVNSPIFYLQQNDILYVKPNKTRVNSAGVGPNIALILSGLSLALTAVVLITNSNN
jgi:polysaccharide export outer membrane protein